ncbi:MAG: hypothetical protein C0502_03730 [Opitutus sp.]|nr:hypothetical protein [Opitutus sp.]
MPARPLLRLLAVLALGLGLSVGRAAPTPFPGHAFSEEEIRQGYGESRVIAKPRPGREAEVDAAENGDPRLRRLKRFERFAHLRVLASQAGESVPALIDRLHASGRYEYVEPDYIVAGVATPNDPLFNDGSQWSLGNDGRSGGLVGADIGARNGWDLQNSAANVVVAVIDSGARLTHEDLADNLWRNPGEIADNGRDDDGNGYVDDVYGIDATASNSGNPTDTNGHGSRVAGIIGAVANNGRGIAGVAWQVRLMPLRFLGSDNRGLTSDAVECIDYAIARGAHIINASYGAVNSTSFSQAERDAVRRARAAGIIFVAASGNDGRNLDFTNQTPATLLVDNVVSVGATGNRDDLEVYSNFGSGMVEILAPGGAILAPAHTGDSAYSPSSGTSFAAPHVSGALALLKARFPGEDYRSLINRLQRGSRGRGLQPDRLLSRAQTSGRLDLPAILAETDRRPLNDDFSEAVRLSGANVKARGANAHATVQAGEPGLGIAGGRSLWWRWTAPTAGVVTVDTSESVAPGNAALTVRAGVFTGSQLDNLTVVPTTAGSSASRFSFTAVPGTEYSFAADSLNGAQGLLVVSIGTAPANNAFAGAATLEGRSVSVTAVNLNADLEPGEPPILGESGARSVWYRWTAPVSGRMQFSAYSDDFDPMLAVYTGTAIAQLTQVGASLPLRPADDIESALVTADVTAGTTYHLKVDTTSGVAGSFTLSLVDSAWQFATGDAVTSSPAIAADGSVYFGSTDSKLYALNPDGTEKWRYTVGGIVDMTTPAVAADGTAYFGANDRVIRAMNPDGTLKWSYTAGGTVVTGFAVAADGNLYTKDSGGNLLALAPDGSLRWQRTVGGETFASPVIGAEGTIHVGASSQGFLAYNADGTLLWRVAADGDIYTSAAIDAAGRLYFATLNGSVYAVSPQGSVVWRRTIGTGFSSSPTLGADGVLYIGGYDRKLHALNTTDGSTRWAYGLPDEVRATAPLVLSDGSVMIGCYDGYLYHLETNGSLRRSYATGRRIRSSPAVSGTRVFFGSNDGKVYALDAGLRAGSTPWPMLQHNTRRIGRALASTPSTPIVAASANVAPGGTLTLQTTATPGVSLQWSRDGVAVAGGTAATLTVTDFQPAHAGFYTVAATNDSGSASSVPAIAAPQLAGNRSAGATTQVLADVRHPNGNIYDQFLLTGPAATISALRGKVTRVSFVDLNDDIVQVEFSGTGSVTLLLDGATGPAAPAKYVQPSVQYMKGNARIYFVGADADSHLSVFSVGTANAVNQSLFRNDVTYDGVADVSSVAVASPTGGFGGLRAGNGGFFAERSLTGLYAPSVDFAGPVIVHDVTATADASPVLITGAIAGGDIWVAGGTLEQLNGRALAIGQVNRIVMRAGADSHARTLPAQNNRAVIERNGVNVTATVVVNPAPATP